MAGIIPAGAGLTGISKLPMWQIRDHPRGCGAHSRPAPFPFTKTGSSPRVRGSLYFFELVDAVGGIIPAGAGLTIGYSLAPSIGWDHPRGCGAHTSQNGISSSGMGSSPRVRCSLLGLKIHRQALRIIPAGAGLTHFGRTASIQSGDHPRGCGAHDTTIVTTAQIAGSSPRVRGSHGNGQEISEGLGIIPAGAGLTWLSQQSSQPA